MQETHLEIKTGCPMGGPSVTKSTKEINRMKAAFAFWIAGLALLAPAGAFAHHSFAAEYDTKKPVTLKGTVTKVEWMNPHARFYLDVADEMCARLYLEIVGMEIPLARGRLRLYMCMAILAPLLGGGFTALRVRS